MVGSFQPVAMVSGPGTGPVGKSVFPAVAAVPPQMLSIALNN